MNKNINLKFNYNSNYLSKFRSIPIPYPPHLVRE